MKTWLASAVFVVALAGCGTGSGRSEEVATGQRPSSANERIERCTERFLERVKGEAASAEQTRRYIEVTYCTRFAERGWVYEDGTLSIAAHTWLLASTSEECASAGSDEPAQTVPCLELTGEPQIIDCAILHEVRRSEVRVYLEQLQRKHEVECDDGTPVKQLGASG